jgi:hypothetical protein
LTETLASGCIKLVKINGDSKAITIWSQQVKTERTIHSNKPEITIRYDGKGNCMLIELEFQGT